MKFTPLVICLLVPMRTVLAGLTVEEVDTLQFMWEEEKLARDVYLKMHEVHGDIQFSNIARSEQRHMDSALYLMELYGVENTGSQEPGTFNNAELQALYDQLIESGLAGRAAAFQVGITIEETDIADLDQAIEETDNEDLIRVYTNLRDASYRHLSAFSRGLANVTGFSGAEYRNGWFRTWMGWLRLDAHPWVQSADGQWSYHVANDTGGRYVASVQGAWRWTAETVYPWCYDMNQRGWTYNGTPGP